MVLAGGAVDNLPRVPSFLGRILGGQRPEDIAALGIHPGGRTILDAVQKSVGLSEDTLRHSRDVLRRFGNMSSATVMLF